MAGSEWYVIANFADVTQGMIDDCVQESFDTLRHSVQGTDRVILKYNGADPAWVASLSLTKYDHAGILAEINGNADWDAVE